MKNHKVVCAGLLFIFMMFSCLRAYSESSSPYYGLLVQAFQNNESLFKTANVTIEEAHLPPEAALRSPDTKGMIREVFGTSRINWIFDNGKLRSDIYDKSEDNSWQPVRLQTYDGEKVISYNVLQKQAHIQSDPRAIIYDFRTLFGLSDPGGRRWSEMIQKYTTEIEKDSLENDTLFILTIHASDLGKTDKIWVATSKNFRVIKEEYYNPKGELKRVLEYEDFEKVNDQMWLPRSAQQLLLVPRENGSFVYNQKNWMRDTTRKSHVIEWQINQPIPTESFAIRLPNDVKVFDDIIGVKVSDSPKGDGKEVTNPLFSVPAGFPPFYSGLPIEEETEGRILVVSAVRELSAKVFEGGYWNLTPDGNQTIFSGDIVPQYGRETLKLKDGYIFVYNVETEKTTRLAGTVSMVYDRKTGIWTVSGSLPPK